MGNLLNHPAPRHVLKLPYNPLQGSLMNEIYERYLTAQAVRKQLHKPPYRFNETKLATLEFQPIVQVRHTRYGGKLFSLAIWVDDVLEGQLVTFTGHKMLHSYWDHELEEFVTDKISYTDPKWFK